MPDRPIRIQRRRSPGWRMPPDTVYVGRPTVWGNPFCYPSAEVNVSEFWKACGPGTPLAALAVERLRGKNLACWCRLDRPCHADVLLEIANAPACEPAEAAHG